MNDSANVWSTLTDQQQDLVMEYIRHGNKMRAYRTAYPVPGQNEKTQQSSCYKVFNNPKVKAVIEHIQAKAIERANLRIEEAIEDFVESQVEQALKFEQATIDAEWVLRRASLLADFNIRKFIRVDSHGNAVYDFSDADDDDWYCIQEYTVEEINRGKGEDTYLVDKLKIKTYDKLRALELVGKHVEVQAFRDQIGVGDPDGNPIQTIERVIVDSTTAKSS